MKIATKILALALTTVTLQSAHAGSGEAKNPFNQEFSKETMSYTWNGIILELTKDSYNEGTGTAKIYEVQVASHLSIMFCYNSSPSEPPCTEDGDGSSITISTSDNNDSIVLKGSIEAVGLDTNPDKLSEDPGIVFKKF